MLLCSGTRLLSGSHAYFGTHTFDGFDVIFKTCAASVALTESNGSPVAHASLLVLVGALVLARTLSMALTSSLARIPEMVLACRLALEQVL